MPKGKETDLIRAALQFLKLRGFMAIRVNSGMIPLGNGPKKRMFRGADPGTSDIIACSPSGRFCAFEGKVGRNKPTELQERFMEDVRANGGIAGAFWDLDDLHDLIEKA